MAAHNVMDQNTSQKKHGENTKKPRGNSTKVFASKILPPRNWLIEVPEGQ